MIVPPQIPPTSCPSIPVTKPVPSQLSVQTIDTNGGMFPGHVIVALLGTLANSG